MQAYAVGRFSMICTANHNNKDKMKILQDQIGLTGSYDGAVAI
jgi:hypothetical protein